MAIDVVSTALAFIASYGLIAIFILLVLDGALLLPVFPGELVMIMAVATYATDPGSLIFLIFLTTAAGLLGSLLLYGITRGGGRRLVERFPRFFMMPRKRRERLDKVFRNPVGQTLVMFLRLLPLTRVLVNIPAGLAKMPIVRFVVLSAIGLLVYHAGFLWFTYEVGRADSPIADQTEQLRQAYASPAWDFVQANAILTGLAIITLGIFLSIRASRNMLRDPEESTGSLIGWLATSILYWGGIALLAATYLDPETVYTLIGLGGLDIHAISASVGYPPTQVLWATGIAAIVVGLVLRRMRANARAHRRQRRNQKRAEAKRETAARRRDVVFRPVPAATASTSGAAGREPGPGVLDEADADDPRWERDAEKREGANLEQEPVRNRRQPRSQQEGAQPGRGSKRRGRRTPNRDL